MALIIHPKRNGHAEKEESSLFMDFDNDKDEIKEHEIVVEDC